jgi:hypothetical protein
MTGQTGWKPYGKALKESDSNAWDTIKTEVDDLMDDIDKELREALAYFG